ncbi:MBL fold metallo-hydrolase [Sediminibacterium ginsengisoli]|uniref:L-ascorbate metabolism protein UlaG, beta-lactamase superfamily n=1 Tax=Sediminibacterium ginsengisoli TaxID=413434 RepID=A0A1T4LCP2_9BACT|nr:MBL fold metallo-hydrolase [Sediminibacterium ginsengisoli]SJZ52562.1 L-ascorbate metabolism protein UlaG, beta-lactamase superfamily [Sediminibacterium ginsengisoli]
MGLQAFGHKPSGQRQQRIEQSPNYRDGRFQNIEPTAVMREGTSFFKILKDFNNRPASSVPAAPVPAQPFSFGSQTPENPVITWFGHSSYIIRHLGFTLLADPVFSGFASPFPIFGKAFNGTGIFDPAQFPEIDVLLITHDHYDHLDMQTVKALKSKVKQVITPLGVGSHLEYWGFKPEMITELDWWEQASINNDIKLTATPARHFSGRGLARAKTLWASFVLQLPGFRLFLGGDSGYDAQFKKIGEHFGSFDLAILECGQYGYDWPAIHMLPEETVQAALDLHAALLLPVHWAKFRLSNHSWNEPADRVTKSAAEKKLKLVTPMIGESFSLDSAVTRPWWHD